MEPKAAHLISRLIRFLDSLPAGFGCGPREQMAIRELVLRLIAGGAAPTEAAAWKTLIAPLVCGDAAQQHEFYERFDEWGASQNITPPSARRPPPRRWPIALAMTLLAASVLTTGAYYRSLFRPVPRPHRPPAPAYTPLQPEATVAANRLQGVVETADGIPLPHATVWVAQRISPTNKLFTDANGRFAIALSAAPTQDAAVTNTPMVLRIGSASGFSVSFSPDGHSLTAGTPNGAMIWDLISGRKVQIDSTSRVDMAVFSPDGRKLATVGDLSETAKLWDTGSWKQIQTLEFPKSTAAAFSPDARYLAISSENGTAAIFDVKTGNPIRVFQGHAGEIFDVAVSPDGRRIATASQDNTARIWDTVTGKELLTLPHPKWVIGLAFSPDGSRLATACDDGLGRVWDTASGRLSVTLSGHSDYPSRVSFSPNGQLLATAAHDRTTKIWNSSSGAEVLTLRGHTDVVYDVAFSPDNSRVATTGHDGTVRIWPISSTPVGASASGLPPSPILATHADYEPVYTELAFAGQLNIIKLGRLKAARRVLVFAPNPPPPHRRFPRWVSIVVALIPVLAALVFFLLLRERDRQRKAFLQQWETHLDLQPVRVHTRSEEDELFQAAEVSDLARELRRRRPEPTSQIAVEPSVRETAERAGLFTPVHRQRRTAREYLVLFESKGERDQQARLWTCLLDRLASLDVWMERYSFRGDPRLCDAPYGERGWVRLEEIAAQHPRHELWVLSTPQRFFDTTTRQPAPWVPALSRWPDRAVLNVATESAEDREKLGALGFAMTAASVAGLACLASDATRLVRQSSSAPYPLILGRDESRWLQGPKPRGESGARELRSLDRQLRAWLGSNGYRCLLACAVYPGMAWNLTLHLALTIIPVAEREQTLSRLVRLPWFRHGRMPQWLRAFFTEKLDPAEHARTVSLLRDFLNRKAQAKVAPASSGLNFARREIAAELGAQGKPPTRDYVFLSFLLGQKPRLRDLEAPAWLRHLLYPHGFPVLRVRRELALVIGILLGILMYRLAEQAAQARPVEVRPVWHEITPPLARTTEAVNSLSARALEIAAAQLGQPADANFPYRHFDRAAVFSSPVGISKKGPGRPGEMFVSSTNGRPECLIEQAVDGGFVTIEPVNGRLSRMYRPDSDFTDGTFVEFPEATTWAPIRKSPGTGPCDKYGLCGYDRNTWKETFLRDATPGTWWVIVRSLPDGAGPAATKEAEDLRKRFPNLNFGVQYLSHADGSNLKYAVVVASGLKDPLMANKIVSFARDLGVSNNAYKMAMVR